MKKFVYIVVWDEAINKNIWQQVGVVYENHDGSISIRINLPNVKYTDEFHIRDNIDVSPEEWLAKEEEIGAAKIREDIEKTRAQRKELEVAVANAKKLLGED